jgi:uncharacterized delta-60 repeat protein
MQDPHGPQPAQAIGLRAWCAGSFLGSQTHLSKKDTTMKFFSRKTRRTDTLKRRTLRLRLEPLEERQLLSGFGSADGAYIVEPWLGSYSAVQIQPGDQKIIAAGQVDPNSNFTDQRMAIARYGSLGNPDNTYGSGGHSFPPLSGVSAPALGPFSESGWDLVLQPDGKAVVSGLSPVNSSANSAFAVARFNTNGTLDSGFGSGGWNTLDARADFFNPAAAVGLQSTGKVVVAGWSVNLNPPYPAEVARFTASGAIDTGGGGFGQGKKGYTFTTFGTYENFLGDLAVQPDDKVVAVGAASDATSSDRLIVARYTASGTLDTTFNGSGYSVFLPPGITQADGHAVALQSDGKIVVTGSCTGTDGAGDMLVARFNTNGTLDTSFGGGSGYVRLDNGAATQSGEDGIGVAIQPDGKIVVGGLTSVTGNPSYVMVARFNVDGTPDATFATGGYKIGAPLPNTGYHSFSGVGVALQSNGSIIVAGNDYSGRPTVTINGVGSGSTASVGSDANGTITSITVTNGGVGYDASTTVTLSGSGGSGATAIATVSNGVVTGITVTNGGTGYDVYYPLLMRFFGSSTSTSSPSASGSTAGSAGVNQVAGRLAGTDAVDPGGAMATLCAEVPGVSTAFVVKRGPKVVPSAQALPAPGTASAALSKTVAQGLDPIFVPQVLDDHPFRNTLIAGKRRRSS